MVVHEGLKNGNGSKLNAVAVAVDGDDIGTCSLNSDLSDRREEREKKEERKEERDKESVNNIPPGSPTPNMV